MSGIPKEVVQEIIKGNNLVVSIILCTFSSGASPMSRFIDTSLGYSLAGGIGAVKGAPARHRFP